MWTWNSLYLNFSVVSSCVNKSEDTCYGTNNGCSACNLTSCSFSVSNTLLNLNEQVLCDQFDNSNRPFVTSCYIGNLTYSNNQANTFRAQNLNDHYYYCTVSIFWF